MSYDELTVAERDALKKLLGRCEVCGPKDPRDLRCHRINRGYQGGKYVLRNISLLCVEHDKERHQGEIMGRKG